MSRSEVAYASYFVYSPIEARENHSSYSRRIRDAVKRGNPKTLAAAAERIASAVADGWCDEVFGRDIVLVPMPKSSPLKPGSLWPPQLIAEALVGVKLAGSMQPLLERTTRVDKSAFSAPGERPSVRQHIDTMAVASTELDLLPPDRIVLVDDMITRGATLAAGAHLVREAYPRADVSAFALVRTAGFVPAVDSIIEPCINTIRFDPVLRFTPSDVGGGFRLQV